MKNNNEDNFRIKGNVCSETRIIEEEHPVNIKFKKQYNESKKEPYHIKPTLNWVEPVGMSTCTWNYDRFPEKNKTSTHGIDAQEELMKDLRGNETYGIDVQNELLKDLRKQSINNDDYDDSESDQYLLEAQEEYLKDLKRQNNHNDVYCIKSKISGNDIHLSGPQKELLKDLKRRREEFKESNKINHEDVDFTKYGILNDDHKLIKDIKKHGESLGMKLVSIFDSNIESDGLPESKISELNELRDLFLKKNESEYRSKISKFDFMDFFNNCIQNGVSKETINNIFKDHDKLKILTKEGIKYLDMEKLNTENIQIIEFFDTILNDKFKEKILKRIIDNDGYCPCVLENTQDTLCPCKDYINSHECHCNLYKRKQSNVKIYIGKDQEDDFCGNKKHPILALREIKRIIENHNVDEPTLTIHTNNIIVINFLYDYMFLFKRNMEFYLEGNLINNVGGIIKIIDYLDITKERNIILKIYNFEKQLKTYYDIINYQSGVETELYKKKYDDLLYKYRVYIADNLNDEQIELYVNTQYYCEL